MTQHEQTPATTMTTVPSTHLLSLGEPLQQGSYRVAVVRWSKRDELSEAICASLRVLGHDSFPFDAATDTPGGADIVFSFAPYGNFMALVDRLAALPPSYRPFFIHWNTEGIPDMHLPWGYVYPLSRLRSWVGRVTTHAGLADKAPFAWLQNRMLRYRYVGDYYSAYHRGLLGIFADSSAIYADLHRRHGLPTTYFPWGSTPSWYADLSVKRDIDVLWLGKRGTKRRSMLLDSVRKELNRHGVDIYMADNDEHPFIFREERTEMMNRSKITLNITRTWYDDNFSRFAMAAPNRSLVVSEPMLPHCPEYRAGSHYVAAPINELAATILHYLSAEEERRKIVDSAYVLVTEQLTMVNSVRRVMEQAHQILTNAAVLHSGQSAVENRVVKPDDA